MIRNESDTGLPERFEIVRGEVVPLSPTGGKHGYVEQRIGRVLGHEGEDADLGTPFVGEVGVVVVRDPQTVRGADAAFLLKEQMPPEETPEGYLLTPPALVAEVLSPNDRASYVQAKVLEYLSAGVRVVWVVDPSTRSVAVYLKGATARILTGDETLIAPGVLDNLRTPEAWLFKGLPQSDQPPL